MRKARDWYFREFHPTNMQDVMDALMSEHTGHLRMVWTYWDMAAALVNHGAIDLDLFNEVNSEHIGVFGRVEPLLPEIRAAMSPQFMINLEKLIDATPQGRQKVAEMRERMKAVMAEFLKRRSQSATQG